MKIYVLKGPKGLIHGTAGETQAECWERSFWAVAEVVHGFRYKYWKRWDASRRAALKLGYRVVACKVVPLDSKP
jgi:hypothetical protein